MPHYPNLRAFIVHGHDHVFRDRVKEHFEETLGLGEAVVLDAVASAGRTVIEKFEQESRRCDIAVVLLTPDDEARTSGGDLYHTARPNVWFELGYFIAFFGRSTGRVLLLYKEGLDIPTDLAGVIYIDATSGLDDEYVAKKIEQELNLLVQRPRSDVLAVDSTSGVFKTDLRIEGTVRLRN